MGEITILFFKVWRNLYLNVNLFKHIRLLNVNRTMEIDDIESFNSNEAKEYVETLVYKGFESLTVDSFKVGEFGYLSIKTLECRTSIPISIPYGVEKLIYPIPLSIFIPKKPIDQQLLEQSYISNLPNTILEIVSVLVEYKPLPVLPPFLRSLKFRYKFNQILEPGFLHGNLREIDFGDQFTNGNTLLKPGDIPYGVEKLDIRDYRKQLEIGTLPDSILDLRIGHVSNLIDPISASPPIQLNLPKSITKLNIKSVFDSGLHIGVGSIQDSITDLTLNSTDYIIDFGSFSCNLKKLTIGIISSIEMNMLPPCLETLVFYRSLKEIKIQHGSLPNTLKTFQYGNPNLSTYDYGWNQSLQIGFFPDSLTSLDFGDNRSFDQTNLISVLPPFLEILILPYSFCEVLSTNSLPNSLKSLSFHPESDYDFEINQVDALPQSLEVLKFGDYYPHDIQNNNILPKTLKQLIIPKLFINKIFN